MGEWLEIAERAEKAAGASIALDRAIWLLAVEKPRPGDKIDQDMIGREPAYTSSVDACLALVGEKLPGWSYEAAGGRDGHIWLLQEDGGFGELFSEGTGKTPALGLLSALARALHAKGNEEGKE